jgi:hypothetical protein
VSKSRLKTAWCFWRPFRCASEGISGSEATVEGPVGQPRHKQDVVVADSKKQMAGDSHKVGSSLLSSDTPTLPSLTKKLT